MKKIIPELVLGNRILCDVSKIKPYWRNARNNKKTIELIKESVTSFGFLEQLQLIKITQL